MKAYELIIMCTPVSGGNLTTFKSYWDTESIDLFPESVLRICLQHIYEATGTWYGTWGSSLELVDA